MVVKLSRILLRYFMNLNLDFVIDLFAAALFICRSNSSSSGPTSDQMES